MIIPVSLNDTNADVIQKILPFVEYRFEHTRFVLMEVREDRKGIVVEATELQIPMDDCNVINSSVKPECNTVESQAHFFIEMMMDMWLKLGATKFYMVWNKDKEKVSMCFNKGMSEEEMEHYWKHTSIDGYDLSGNFWKREWWKGDEAAGGGRA